MAFVVVCVGDGRCEGQTKRRSATETLWISPRKNEG